MNWGWRWPAAAMPPRKKPLRTICRPRAWRSSILRRRPGTGWHFAAARWCALPARNCCGRRRTIEAGGHRCAVMLSSIGQEAQMFKSILVPLDLADTDLAKPAIATAATLSQTWNGMVRLLNGLPMTPVMLGEYVTAEFVAPP